MEKGLVAGEEKFVAGEDGWVAGEEGWVAVEDGWVGTEKILKKKFEILTPGALKGSLKKLSAHSVQPIGRL